MTKKGVKQKVKEPPIQTVPCPYLRMDSDQCTTERMQDAKFFKRLSRNRTALVMLRFTEHQWGCFSEPGFLPSDGYIIDVCLTPWQKECEFLPYEPFVPKPKPAFAIQKRIVKVGAPRLNNDKVREIKELLAQGKSTGELSEQYGVNRSTILNIKNGKRQVKEEE